MKVAKLLVLSLAVAFTIIPSSYAAHSAGRVEGPPSWFLSDWFHPTHPSTWLMDGAQYRVLLNLRKDLTNCVHGGDLAGVKAVLNREVKEVEETSGGAGTPAVIVPLKSSVRIEYFDVIIPLMIVEAMELGLPDIVQALCEHGMFNVADTARYVNAAREREGVVKQLYAKATEGISKVAEGAERDCE